MFQTNKLFEIHALLGIIDRRGGSSVLVERRSLLLRLCCSPPTRNVWKNNGQHRADPSEIDFKRGKIDFSDQRLLGGNLVRIIKIALNDFGSASRWPSHGRLRTLPEQELCDREKSPKRLSLRSAQNLQRALAQTATGGNDATLMARFNDDGEIQRRLRNSTMMAKFNDDGKIQR